MSFRWHQFKGRLVAGEHICPGNQLFTSPEQAWPAWGRGTEHQCLLARWETQTQFKCPAGLDTTQHTLCQCSWACISYF